MTIADFIPDGVKRAIASKAIKWLATMAAGAVANWLALLLAKYGVPADGQTGDLIKEISGAVFALVAGGGALAYSVWDAKKVDAKITVAAAAGVSRGVELAQAGQDQQLQADQTVANAVKDAIAQADKAKPADKAAIVESMKQGTF